MVGRNRLPVLLRNLRRRPEAYRSISNEETIEQMREERQTHFGFRTVDESEKVKEVYSVFENVADSYDRMNDAMSLGVHRIWKDTFIRRLAPSPGTRLLDSAGGTADITFRFLDYVRNKENRERRVSKVTVCDINSSMLEVGRARALRLGYENLQDIEISWKQCNAESLNFKDESYDAYTIAFGIRNVTHIEKALSEAYRVLAPGGRFLCLEFSHVDNDLLRWFYDRYSFDLIPVLGTAIAGQWQPYQYLVESIRKFPRQEEFKSLISAAGFRNVSYENLSCGVVAIHSGFKL